MLRGRAPRHRVECPNLARRRTSRARETEELPDAAAVLDPFHVVRLAGDAMDQCRRRVQQEIHGHRGRTGDPLYHARRTLHTGADLLTDKQRQRIRNLFTDDEHVHLEATWGIYQRMIAAYREPGRMRGRDLMTKVIESVSSGVPTSLTEVRTLGRTLKHRATDVLAYFDRPGTSNGPTEAINGRLEHLRGIRPRLPQPHQLHRKDAYSNRRIQATATPSFRMSHQTRHRSLATLGGYVRIHTAWTDNAATQLGL